MKTNDDDNNVMSITTEDDSPLLKRKMTFLVAVLKLNTRRQRASITCQKEGITCLCKTIHTQWHI